MVYLSHLSLNNFRNFMSLELDLPPGVVVLYGANAQGKTGILEAIYLLAIARSFRAENEYEMVNWRAGSEDSDTLVAGTVEKGDQKLRVHVGYERIPVSEPSSATPRPTESRTFGVRRQIRVSRVKRTAAELVGLVCAVVFTADDIELVQGPPSARRRYLDVLMSQVDPSYLRSLQRYQRVVQQRNRLLKLLQERRAEDEELAFWNGELVKEGSWIVSRRLEAMGPLSTFCREGHNELTGDAEDLSVEYNPNVTLHRRVAGADEVEREFITALETARGRELALGSTVVGPHRDDFKLRVGDVDMGTYSSRGQARTLALSLRLAEAAYLASARDEGPIVLLDDVLSEMDSFRRGRVLNKVSQYEQVIITTTDAESIERSLLSGAQYYEVEGGRVSKVAP